jgi:hypothetical protein
MNTFELNWEGKHAKFVPKLIERISFHSTPAAKHPLSKKYLKSYRNCTFIDNAIALPK